MFQIKRSLTAVVLAAAMVFGSTAASADASRLKDAGDRTAEGTKVRTVTENGDEVEVSIEGSRALVVYKGNRDRRDDYFSADSDVSYGWVQVAIRVAIALFELMDGEGGGGGEETPKGSGKESGSGSSGGNDTGGSSGCSINVNNTGGGTVTINQTCNPT